MDVFLRPSMGRSCVGRFPQAVRDDFVLAARNIAKFIQASDAFALGQEVTQDGSAGKNDRDCRQEP